jgi:hypothetical protein
MRCKSNRSLPRGKRQSLKGEELSVKFNLPAGN